MVYCGRALVSELCSNWVKSNKAEKNHPEKLFRVFEIALRYFFSVSASASASWYFRRFCD